MKKFSEFVAERKAGQDEKMVIYNTKTFKQESKVYSTMKGAKKALEKMGKEYEIASQLFYIDRIKNKIVTEMKSDDMMDELMELIGSKADQDMWNWFEENMGDSGIYAGDAVPEDYLEAMDDSQTKALYKAMKKYL